MGFNNHARYWWNLCSHCIRACLLAFVFLISQNANALTDQQYNWKAFSSGAVKSWADWNAAAKASFSAGTTVSFIFWSGSEYRFIAVKGTGSCPAGTFDCLYQRVYKVEPVVCPFGQIANSTTGVCEVTCASKTGQSLGFGATAYPGLGCNAGCSVGLSSGGYTCTTSNDPTIKKVCGNYEYLGSACEVGDPSFGTVPSPDQPTTTEYDCLKQGKSFGYVNGVAVCTTPKSPDVTTSTKTASSVAADGTSTSTSTNKTTTDNGDGTVTTTTTKTTTGGGGGGGTSTETETETEDKATFCEENPESQICLKGSFSGQCGGDFTCEGDAVQCAVAREQHIRNCEIFDKVTELSKLGNQLAEGQDVLGGDNPFSETNKLKIDFSGSDGQLDQSRLWAGQCISDQTFTVYGQSITLDTSKLCDVIGLFGNLLVAISMISGMMIIGKGA